MKRNTKIRVNRKQIQLRKGIGDVWNCIVLLHVEFTLHIKQERCYASPVLVAKRHALNSNVSQFSCLNFLERFCVFIPWDLWKSRTLGRFFKNLMSLPADHVNWNLPLCGVSPRPSRALRKFEGQFQVSTKNSDPAAVETNRSTPLSRSTDSATSSAPTSVPLSLYLPVDDTKVLVGPKQMRRNAGSLLIEYRLSFRAARKCS